MKRTEKDFGDINNYNLASLSLVEVRGGRDREREGEGGRERERGERGGEREGERGGRGGRDVASRNTYNDQERTQHEDGADNPSSTEE